jgi:hypothetical protein
MNEVDFNIKKAYRMSGSAVPSMPSEVYQVALSVFQALKHYSIVSLNSP